MNVTHLRTNRMENPLGFAMEQAHFSYTVEDTAALAQQSARIEVSTSPDFAALVWDSGRRTDIDSICCPLPLALAPRTRYYWRVTVWADNGEMAISPAAWFETAKAPGEPWAGQFITASFGQELHPIFTRTFTVDRPVRSARLYALGLGVYELHCNGSRLGDEVLLPGLHAYDSWLQYQTFVPTPVIGKNVLEATLGNGWYKGPYGLKSSLPRHGEEFAFLAELHLLYEDGTEEVIGTDSAWQVRKGPVLADSIYDGETMDARAEGTALYPVQPAHLDTDRLSARLSPPIRVQQRLTPTLLHTPAGETVLDFGQNMVGWVEFEADLPAGTEVLLEYGEILQQGNFYRDNLRTARCCYRYISDGSPRTVHPHFTFYGFRFVKVSGWVGALTPEAFSGCVIHSTMEETGSITTSDPLLNRLIENVRWGQKGNFLDVPTDCPQRDERMGWTGDAEIFADTACYNMDTYAFYTKFGRDLWCEQQRCGGSVPYVVPMSRYELNGASVWGDAATIIPWQSYLHFGDPAILQAQYPSMKAWVDYIRRADDAHGSRRLWQCGRHFGDWLALDGKVDGGVYGSTDPFLIATAYYCYSARLVAKAAGVLGLNEDARAYAALAEEIRTAFQQEYFTASGRLAVETQTAAALVIMLDLVPETARERTCGALKELLKNNNFRLNTGFVGTPWLCPALSEAGWGQYAWELLLNREYPGWLYEVCQGATTIWERWNSVLPDGSISGTGMNSLNHYAYGSIAGWMYRYMIGLRPVEEAPGFRRAVVAPQPSQRLASAGCTLKTPAGTYRVGWALANGRLTLNLTIPFGASARVVLPRAAHAVVEGLPSGTDFAVVQGDLAGELPAGSYRFTYTPAPAFCEIPGPDSNLNTLLANPKTAEIILRHFPRAASGIPFQNEGTALDEISKSPFAEVSDEALRAMFAELAQVTLPE